ncbi:hypothetical protein Q7P36_003240 [Cladosporium allicinum]
MVAPERYHAFHRGGNSRGTAWKPILKNREGEFGLLFFISNPENKYIPTLSLSPFPVSFPHAPARTAISCVVHRIRSEPRRRRVFQFANVWSHSHDGIKNRGESHPPPAEEMGAWHPTHRAQALAQQDAGKQACCRPPGRRRRWPPLAPPPRRPHLRLRAAPPRRPPAQPPSPPRAPVLSPPAAVAPSGEPEKKPSASASTTTTVVTVTTLSSAGAALPRATTADTTSGTTEEAEKKKEE